MRQNIRILALASFIEGVMAFIWLASIPTSGRAFSPVRLISLSGLFLVSLGCLAVFISARSANRFVEKIEQVANGRAGLPASFLLMAVSFSVWVAILYKTSLLLVVDEAMYTRLLPMAVFGVLFCLQLGFLFLIPHLQKVSWMKVFASVWKPSLILLGCFLVLWGLMSTTHLGFIFDNVGLSWGPPGTPVTFAQVNLVIMLSILMAFAWNIFRRGTTSKKLLFRDMLVFVVLWGLAVLLWWNEPVSATHFNPPRMAPNYETYPNSDALIFDRSSYHLIFGTGFSNQLIRRPLYVGMLALFHKIGGFNYEGTIFLQILILAFIPPLTFLITSKLSNRLAGLMAGGLILLREKNSIELSDRIVTSNAKLLMSDMIALLGVIAFIYVTLRLLSARERSPWLLGIAGACLGLSALVRAQVFILAPPLLLFILLEKRPLKMGIKESVLIMAGAILVMFPWAWRNWNLTGTFILDDRGEEKLLARNYSESPVGFPDFLPGETEKEYSARIKREIIAFILEHPSDVAAFVSNHFFRNLATSAVYMAPVYSADSPHGLVDRTPFWDEWQGTLTGGSKIPLFITLALIALGIGMAQAKDPRAGWFPFIALLFYSAGNALVRSSGWRFSMPADWIIIVYYSIALAYLPSRIKFLFDDKQTVQIESETVPFASKPLFGAVVLCLLFLLGASVPIAEKIIPARDLSHFLGDAEKKLSGENILSPDEIDTFLEQGNAVFYSGIALYPRYVIPKSRIYLAYVPRDFSFLHFWLANDGDNQIIFPTEIPPRTFPHGSKVSVMGCKRDNYVLARVIVLHSSSMKIFVQDGSMDLNCPTNALVGDNN